MTIIEHRKRNGTLPDLKMVDCDPEVEIAFEKKVTVDINMALQTRHDIGRQGNATCRPVFEKTCKAAQKNVKSHVFLNLKKT